MKLLRRLVAAILVVMITTVAHADLISLGDATLDTRNGLEWLDLTETQGTSYDQILAGTGGYLEDGWLPATGNQIDDLFFRYSFFVPERDDIDIQIAPEASALQLLGSLRTVLLLGPTISFNLPGGGIVVDDPLDPRQIATSGYYDDGTGGDRTGLATMIVRFGWESAPQQCQFCVDWNTFDDFAVSGNSGIAQGVFLVRPTSVPEPGTLALLGIGLAAMGMARRRKR